MRATLRTGFCWLFLVAASFAGGPAPGLSLEQYRAELAKWGSRVAGLSSAPQNSSGMLRELPEAWLVNTKEGPISTSAKSPERQLIVKDLETRLAAMQQAAAEYSSLPGTPADAHQRMEQILSAREFARLHGPTPLELLWQRVLAWIDKQLDKLGDKLPVAEESGPIFAWCVIAAVCCVLGVYLYRKRRQIEFDLRREILPFSPSGRNWRAWLEDAREQAARENWSEAIHLAFWSGVSRLESEGFWRPDGGRTAREYLAAIDSTNPLRPVFASLVTRFEAAWYAGRPAYAQDFRRMLADLEKLGCR